MVKYTLVMDLAKQFSTRLGKDQLINSALMGDGRYILNQYDPSKVYHLGDKIPYLTDTGELVILTALEDNITGPLDLRKWEEWDIISETIRLYQDFIQLSWHVPKSRLNRVWLSIKKESMADFEGIDINRDGILVYSNFIISKERPTMTKNVIWGKVTELVDGAGTVDPGGWDDDYEFPHIDPNTGDTDDNDNTEDPSTPGKEVKKLTRDYYRMVDVYPSTYRNMTSIDAILDTKDLTDTSYMFALSSRLTEIPKLDTRKVTIARSMFAECGSMVSLPSKNFDELVDATAMFNSCGALREVKGIDFSSVTSASNMFTSCGAMNMTNTQFGNLEKANDMFTDCRSSTFDNVTFGKIKDASYMFRNCVSMKKLPKMDISHSRSLHYFLNTTPNLRGEFKQTFHTWFSDRNEQLFNFNYMLDDSGLDSVDITFINDGNPNKNISLSNYTAPSLTLTRMANLKRARIKCQSIMYIGNLADGCPELRYIELQLPRIRDLELMYGVRSDTTYRMVGFDLSGMIRSCQKLKTIIIRCEKSKLSQEHLDILNSRIADATVGACQKVLVLDYDEEPPAGTPRFEDIDITVPAQ